MKERNRVAALLSKGYFPRELPPVFTTKDLGEHSFDIIGDWRNDKVFKEIEVKKKNRWSIKEDARQLHL